MSLHAHVYKFNTCESRNPHTDLKKNKIDLSQDYLLLKKKSVQDRNKIKLRLIVNNFVSQSCIVQLYILKIITFIMNELIMNRNFDSESKIICCVIKRTLSNLNEQRAHIIKTKYCACIKCSSSSISRSLYTY